MKLTGKALKDFEKHVKEVRDDCGFGNTGKRLFYIESIDSYKFINTEHYIENCGEVILNTLIMDWFDSVGVYFNNGLSFIKTKKYKCEIYQEENDNILGNCFVFKGKYLSHDKEGAIEQAIIKANEIYNEKNTD